MYYIYWLCPPCEFKLATGLNGLADGLKCNVKLFTDDTLITIVVHEPKTPAEKLNHDLNLINQWAINGECLFIQAQVSKQ